MKIPGLYWWPFHSKNEFIMASTFQNKNARTVLTLDNHLPGPPSFGKKTC